MKTRLLSILYALLISVGILAHDLEPLHVDGRYLKNSKGEIVTLHGYLTVLEPGCQADEFRSSWDGYDVATCLKNKKAAIDRLLASGWKMDYVRFLLDPYWCCEKLLYNGEEYKTFDFERFKKYFEELFLPLIDYFHEKGIYTLLWPPHGIPGTVEVGDEFQEHLLLVWDYVSSHPRIRNNPGVMFELANEPVCFKCRQGKSYTGLESSVSVFKEVRDYWQPIVNKIRSHCDNIIYVPGMFYESDHAGFADYPVQGDNIGYAVHWYPGWWGNMRKDWEGHVFPIAYKAPIIITENAWAPYSNYLGGNSETSTSKFGKPLKDIVDELGNVSWNCYEPEEDYYYLVNSSSSSEKAVIANDPEACFKAMYQWWDDYSKTKVMPTSQLKAKAVSFDEFPKVITPGQKVLAKIKAEFTNGMTWDISGDAEYIVEDESVLSIKHGVIRAMKNGSTNIIVKYTDGAGQVFSRQFEVTSALFPLSAQGFNPNLHGDDGSFNESTGEYSSGYCNMGGWSYAEGLDLTSYRYLVVQLNHEQQCGAAVRIWDDVDIWSDNEAWNDYTESNGYGFYDATELVIDLQSLHKKNGQPLDLSHIYHVGIWINGYAGSVSIKQAFLSDDGVTPANSYQTPIYVYADHKVIYYGDEVPALTYSSFGPRINGTPSLSTTANSASPAGTYPITLEKGTVNNDQVTYLNGTLTVMKAPLMVGVQDITINEGDAIPPFTLTYNGFRNGDSESNALTTKPIASTIATSNSLPGTYPITISGGESTNYHPIYHQGTLTIKESPTWKNIVINSDLEGNDVSCFYSRKNYTEDKTVKPVTIIDGVGKDDSRGITITSIDNPSEAWFTQFFVHLTQTVPEGTKYRLSFDYKTNRGGLVTIDSHAKPGEHIGPLGEMWINSSSWEHFWSEGIISEEQSSDEKEMHTIAFNLAHNDYATTHYFDNIVFKIYDPKGTEPIILGDLNDDRSVSITDIVLIIDVIAGSITDENKVKAADVNKDGYVTITDCVAAIDLIAAQTKGVCMNRASAMPVCTDYISASMKDNLLTVNLDNENRYTAFQMVVTMPEGMTLDKAVIDKLRGTDHQLTVRNLGNGQYLLAGFSMGNSELAGNSGRLLTIGTKGQTKGDIIISDIEFATAEAEAYRLVPITISNAATGIYQIENREWKQDDVIFDLQGRQVNQPTHGLYIKNGKLIIVKQKK